MGVPQNEGADQLAMGIDQSLLSIWFAQHVLWALATFWMYQAPTNYFTGGTRDEQPIGEQQAYSSPSEDLSVSLADVFSPGVFLTDL